MLGTIDQAMMWFSGMAALRGGRRAAEAAIRCPLCLPEHGRDLGHSVGFAFRLRAVAPERSMPLAM